MAQQRVAGCQSPQQLQPIRTSPKNVSREKPEEWLSYLAHKRKQSNTAKRTLNKSFQISNGTQEAGSYHRAFHQSALKAHHMVIRSKACGTVTMRGGDKTSARNSIWPIVLHYTQVEAADVGSTPGRGRMKNIFSFCESKQEQTRLCLCRLHAHSEH